jgi:tryptophan halogenase
MEIPDSLRERVELFRQSGHVYMKENELMTVHSWVAIMMGQDIEPQTYHQFARLGDRELKEFLRKYHAQVAEVVNALPQHADFVRQYAGANPEAWTVNR